MTVDLASVVLGGTGEPWRASGFAIDGDRIPLGNGALTFDADAEPGIVALVVEGFDGGPGAVDRIPVVAAGSPGRVETDDEDKFEHPNGACELDHVVVMTDSLERTSAAIASGLGLDQRRIRETPTVRQAFHRFPDRGGHRGCIVEVVESDRVARPALWGLVLNVVDLDAAVGLLGPERIGRPKPAVQPGRRIATVRRSAGLGPPVALMSRPG